MPATRLPHAGLSRELVMALDIGTSYSGVSFCLLDPGSVPQIQGVTRFPADEHLAGNSKIPSLIYYDKKGLMKAAGAEALLDSNIKKAEEEGWELLQWWKLLLSPRNMIKDIEVLSQPTLPKGKTIVNVFADFMSYLYSCAKKFIIDALPSGGVLWDSVGSNVKFVLTHPNGWEGAQQALMRRAAVLAGLVPNSQAGHSRIAFVTEGEASFNYCATNCLSVDAFQEDKNILIIDAGGGTVDISGYSIVSTIPLSVEEVFSPECLMQGSEFVTFRAADYMRRKLGSSRFNTPEDLATLTSRFDTKVKRIFADQEEATFIKFGSPRESDTPRGILRGQLKLSGTEVAAFFEPCIDAIVETVNVNFKHFSKNDTNVFLVGGFAASPWLFKQLQEEFESLGITLSRPDGHTSKAVADGAVSFFLENFVTTRVAKYTYGVPCCATYNRFDKEHKKRAHKITTSLSGEKVLGDSFSSILLKGSRVVTTEEFASPMVFNMRPLDSHLCTSITCYKGQEHSPDWVDKEPDMFSTLCRINADISAVPKILKTNPDGEQYYEQIANIVLLFGLTELKAQLCWDQNGVEKRSDTKIIYDDEDPIPLSASSQFSGKS